VGDEPARLPARESIKGRWRHHTIAAVREVIEVKLTSGPTPEDLARLAQVGDLIKASQLVLLCRVRKSVTTGRQWVTNLAD